MKGIAGFCLFLSLNLAASPDRRSGLRRGDGQTDGLKLGDTLEILDEDFTMVGLSEGITYWTASFIFLEKRGAEWVFLCALGRRDEFLAPPVQFLVFRSYYSNRLWPNLLPRMASWKRALIRCTGLGNW